MSVCQTFGVLQVLREDKLLLGFQKYIGESLGGAFTQGQPWTLEDVLPDSTALRPIIFILTSGADPTAMLQVPLPSCTSCVALYSNVQQVSMVKPCRSNIHFHAEYFLCVFSCAFLRIQHICMTLRCAV